MVHGPYGKIYRFILLRQFLIIYARACTTTNETIVANLDERESTRFRTALQCLHIRVTCWFNSSRRTFVVNVETKQYYI